MSDKVIVFAGKDADALLGHIAAIKALLNILHNVDFDAATDGYLHEYVRGLVVLTEQLVKKQARVASLLDEDYDNEVPF